MTEQNPTEIKRILSLDGGGTRGLITARWLEALEVELGSPLRENFDLIAGTSSGSILACAISAGIPASEIVRLYKENVTHIFPKQSTFWGKYWLPIKQTLFSYKYDGKGLEKFLQEAFKEQKFCELEAKTLIVTYDVKHRTPLILKSFSKRFDNLRTWEVVRASAAAQTYFPTKRLNIRQKKYAFSEHSSTEMMETPLIDGGNVENNPTLCAIAEAIRQNSSTFQLKDLIIVSIGSGRPVKSYEPDRIKNSAIKAPWSALKWGVPTLSILFDSSVISGHYIASQLCNSSRYFRLNLNLEEPKEDGSNSDKAVSIHMDDTSAEHLEQLERLATNFLENENKNVLNPNEKLRNGNTLIQEIKKLLEQDSAGQN